MNYALLQKTLEIPSVEKLKAAFRGSGVLTAVDAAIVAKDAYGILTKGLTAEKAHRLQGCLWSEGVETEIVAENLLPQIPPAKQVRKIECTPEALVIFDPLERSFPLEWSQVLMIAAGSVRLQKFDRIRTEKKVTRCDWDGRPQTETEVDYVSQEKSASHFLLEIIVSRAVLRYSIDANKPLLFQHLGPHFDPDLARSFALFVQTVLSFAPSAAVNRGAYYLRENQPEPFAYPSKNAFFEEIIWLLWRLKKERGMQE